MTASLIWGAVPFAVIAVVAWLCRRANKRDARRLDRRERLHWCLERHPSRRRVPGLPVDGRPLTMREDAEFRWLKLMHNHAEPVPEVIYEDAPETGGDWG